MGFHGLHLHHQTTGCPLFKRPVFKLNFCISKFRDERSIHINLSNILRYLHLSISIFRYCVLLLHYMYLIPLVTSQMWMNDVKYNQVLNQTLVPPESTSYPAVYKVIQTSCTFTSFENTFMINHYKTYHIYYSEMDQSAQ